ncbi:restriction endonuclease subunit S [Aeromonas veronii]|uniref:restriction endonuclease subunit S n=1 Tax=Aeromonas veronii TaxID=654 RepID=UPI0022457DC8|nr:restriction endonuclease subunit S [Aeromonas veronii]MCX0432607.1 restriction endonuclease subunit S [Aeromonas veronii]
MAINLTSMRLEDCMDAIIDYRGKTPTKTTSGIPLITAKIIKNGRIQDATEFIAEDDYASWMRRGIPQSGDVVLTTEAPLGEVAQLDASKIALAQRVITLRGKKGLLDNDFLLYLLQSHDVQHQLDGRGTGSTVKGIKQSELKEVILSFPPITAQKRIAKHLKDIDNKITLNQKISQTLEQMALALFKSWFVDFDPVVDNALDTGFFEQELDLPDELLRRAEARKAVRAQAGFKSLPAATRQLFPTAFEPCAEPSLGLGGWVPKGWNIKKIENLIELVYGKALKSTDRIDGPVPVYGSGGITGYHNESMVDGPSIIIGRKGTVGSLYWEDKPFFPIDTVFYVRSEKPLTYCFYLLQTLGLADMNTDAAVPGLNRNNVYRLQATTPDDDLLNAFDTLVTKLRKRIFANTEQLTTLINLRDGLLPKLISGELSLDKMESVL